MLFSKKAQSAPPPKRNYRLDKAFTLAEVLITLGIIGVVAAITMPTLIQNKQDKELIVKTKKVWSDINNAFLLSQQDNGVVGDNSILFNASDSNLTITKNLAKYFNGSKVCESDTQAGCTQYSYDVKYSSKQLDADNSAATTPFGKDNYKTKIILANGAVISISSNHSGCAAKVYSDFNKNPNGQIIYNEDGTPSISTYTSTTCANLEFDVNGPQGPNQFGRDVYHFWVKHDRISPCFNKELGGTSFKNILSGKDKLEYLNYQKGQKFD